MQKNRLFKMELIIEPANYFYNGCQYIPKKFILEEDFDKLYLLTTSLEENDWKDDEYQNKLDDFFEKFSKQFTISLKRFIRETIGRSVHYLDHQVYGEFDYCSYKVKYNVPEPYVNNMQQLGFEIYENNENEKNINSTLLY